MKITLIKKLRIVILLIAPFTLVLFSMSTYAADSEPKKVGFGIFDASGSSMGGSFNYPSEAGWKQKRSNWDVEINKEGKSPEEGSQIEAYVIKMEKPISPIGEFINYIKSNIQASFSNNPSFKIVSLEVNEDANLSQCVRGHVLLESINPAKSLGLFSEQFFLSCGMLKHKAMGLEIRYYHRYYGKNKDESFSEKANQLLNSTIINDK